jgi:hypothetical protein
MNLWTRPIHRLRCGLLAAAAAAQLVFCAPATAIAQESSGETLSRCDALYEALTDTITASGVRDGSTFTVRGIPWLRTSRFLDEMRYFITDREAWQLWLDWLAEEGRSALLRELEQLPDGAVSRLCEAFAQEKGAPLGGPDPMQEVGRMAQICLNRTLMRTQDASRLQSLLTGRGGNPDDYRITRRIFGLYPLFALPIGTAVTHYRRKVSNRYKTPLARLKSEGRLERYAAAPRLSDTDATATADVLAAASKNPLRIPRLSQEQMALLAYRFAPVLEPDVTGDYDIPGAAHWQNGLVAIDPDRPTLYYYGSHTILRGAPMLQLNYVLWYTKRPRRHLFDIDAGRIHGLTLRLTLDETGRPIMVDVIHNCGCYHFFFPSSQVFKAPRRERLREDAFVPQWLPPLRSDDRLAVRIETKRHWVERLYQDSPAKSATKPYALVPYEVLEALPRDSGKTESIFTPDGLVKGRTERMERFFLFSVGIPATGSMRQRGHHPTALIGRRTFDDPRLFEKFFFLQD